MKQENSDRGKKAILIILMVAMIVNISTGNGKCTTTYKEGVITSRYEGYIINVTKTNLNFFASFNITQDDYTVIFNHTTTVATQVEDMIHSFLVCTIESINGLAKYSDGIKHTSWFPREAVYNESNDLLRVYDVSTLTLLYMEGQANVNGNDTFVIITMIGFVVDDSIAGPFSFFFWVIGAIVVIVPLSLGIYVFGLRKKVQTRKQVKTAKKSGRKMNNFKKEIDERKKKLLKKQEKQEKREEKKKKSPENTE